MLHHFLAHLLYLISWYQWRRNFQPEMVALLTENSELQKGKELLAELVVLLPLHEGPGH
jgi:hypothetical protein